MRILLLGEGHPWSGETGYAREFRRLGHVVEIWNNKKPSLLFARQNWWKMSRFSKFLYDNLASVRFLQFALKWKPDVLFLPKAENIHSRVVAIVKEKTGAKLVVWYPDHPFKPDMTSMNVLRNLRRTELFYIWGHFLIESLYCAGAPDVRYLPFAFDPEAHQLAVETGPREIEKYSCDICFVGAWDRERERDLAPLARYDLAIWGPGWKENLEGTSPLRRAVRGGALYNEQLVHCYRASKILFNHLRRHNGSAHNMRAMEISGIGGGVQLVRRTPELCLELFRESDHFLGFDFESEDSLHEQIHWALQNPQACKRMSEKAQQHVFENHLLKHRIALLDAHISETRNRPRRDT